MALALAACAPRPAKRFVSGTTDVVDAASPDTAKPDAGIDTAVPDRAAASPDMGVPGGTGGGGGTGGTAATGGTGGVAIVDAQPPPPDLRDASAAGGSGGTPADGPPDVARPDRSADPPADAPPDVPPDLPPPPPRVALFVSASTTLVAVDESLRGRLVALGLSVVVTTPGAVSAADATDKAVVIISGTIDSAMLGTKLRTVAVPVLSMEPNIMDDMLLSANATTVTGQTQIAIVTSADPLAGGLEGTVAVYTSAASLVVGTPASGAVIVATVVGDATRAAIYRYSAGASLVGGTPAPAKRIAFFLNDNQATISLSANGLRLFDAAIDWALMP